MMLPHLTVQAVGAAKQLLQLCALAGRAVNANELYKAFKLLERAQAEFLGPSSDPTQCVPPSDHCSMRSACNSDKPFSHVHSFWFFGCKAHSGQVQGLGHALYGMLHES